MTSASRAPRRMARRLFHMLQVLSDPHMRRLRDSVLVVRRTTRTFPVKTKKTTDHGSLSWRMGRDA